jgi:hypothetical protein
MEDSGCGYGVVGCYVVSGLSSPVDGEYRMLTIGCSLLSLFTTLAFIYYYHCHLANFPAPGLPRGGQKASGTGEIGTISAPIRDGEEHQMSSIATQTIPRTAPRADDAYTGNATTGQFNNPSQPTHIPQSLPQKTYPSHEVGSHEGYGAPPARI